MENSINNLFSELNEKLDNWYFFSDGDVKCKIFGLKDYQEYLQTQNWVNDEWSEFTINKKLMAFNEFDKLNQPRF
jgi:hypothetical protein